MGDGHVNVRFFREAATLECIEIVDERCTGRRGADTQRVAVCQHLAASGHIHRADPVEGIGTANGRRHFDPSEIERSARSANGRKVGHGAGVHVQRDRHFASV
jgi:hypothetical protein